ncbi:DNA topoisomerase 1 [Tulasnella sp. 419]|nr:DNA topoisomerase 1 [Tulasnella sp. 419]
MPRRIASDSESDGHDGTPIHQSNGLNGNTPSRNTAAARNGNRKRTHAQKNVSSSDDEDNQPLAKRTKSEKSSADAESTSTLAVPPPTSTKRKLPSDSESSDDDVPLASQNKPSVTPHESDDDDDKPLATVTRKPPSSRGKPRPSYKEESDSDDAPLARRSAKSKKTAVKPESEEDSDDDEAPKSKSKSRSKPSSKKSQSMKPALKKSKPPKKKTKKEESDEDEGEDEVAYEDDGEDAPSSFVKKLPQNRTKSDTPASDKPAKSTSKAKAKVKEESASPKKESAKREKTKKEEEKEEEEEIHRWWEQQQLMDGDTSIKWNTLEHNGVMFPPPYAPLPKSVKMKYNGHEITLSPEAEEVAGFFAALLETDHAADDKFKANFFKDWLTVLKDNPSPGSDKIKEFDKCDFRPMFLHFEAEKAAKKAMSAAEKKKLKAERDVLEAPYRECVLDGRKEKVGNFRIEPPGLFRGRGDHPRKGALKFRVSPDDIILNIGKGAPVPKPNAPGNWGKIVHDQTVTWLANWKENVNGNFKYVFLAAGSSIKGQSDMMKFEKARDLKVSLGAAFRCFQ